MLLWRCWNEWNDGKKGNADVGDNLFFSSKFFYFVLKQKFFVFVVSIVFETGFLMYISFYYYVAQSNLSKYLISQPWRMFFFFICFLEIKIKMTKNSQLRYNNDKIWSFCVFFFCCLSSFCCVIFMRTK